MAGSSFPYSLLIQLPVESIQDLLVVGLSLPIHLVLSNNCEPSLNVILGIIIPYLIGVNMITIIEDHCPRDPKPYNDVLPYEFQTSFSVMDATTFASNHLAK